MGHQPHDVALLTADAGDVACGAVRIRAPADAPFDVAVSEDDAALALESVQGLVVGEVVALVMGDGHAQHPPGRHAVGEGGLATVDA